MRYALFFVLFCSITLRAQVYRDTVFQPQGTVSYYNLAQGHQFNFDFSQWDLAFECNASRTASVLVNSAHKRSVYVYPMASKEVFTQVDSSGIHQWAPYYNSYKRWSLGALNKMSSDPFDMGWGMYNMQTHKVQGDSLYFISTPNGVYQFYIKELDGSVYTIEYANAEGSGAKQFQVNRSDFANRNFAYWSIGLEKSMNLEPPADEWDLRFGEFQGPLEKEIQTGVLINKNLKVASKIEGEELPSPEEYSEHIASIGYRWKQKENQDYVVDQDQVFFVKKDTEEIYRIRFVEFEPGRYIFEKERLKQNTGVRSFLDQGVILYPNPVQDRLYLLFDVAKGSKVKLEVINQLGQQVQSHQFFTHSFSEYAINTQDLERGTYFLRLQVGANRYHQTFQKQ